MREPTLLKRLAGRAAIQGHTMRRKQPLLFSIIFFCLSGGLCAQNANGIIDPSRRIDWSQAGIPGGIPNRTIKCGATIAPYGTSGAPASAATINNAIAACPAGQFVLLGAGTFYLNTGIDFGNVDNVTVRGQGANTTFIVFSGKATNCNVGADVCMNGANSAVGSENNICDWTAGYAPGTTVITLSNCGTSPPWSNISNLHVGSILILDQVDEAADTGQIWNCATMNVCANTIQGGFARADGPSVNGVAIRSQQQGSVVTNINGNAITISPGLYMPNWRSGQLPQAWYANSYRTLDGIENLSMDHSGSTATVGITMMNCYKCWVQGVRSTYAGRSHVFVLGSSHSVVRDSYLYQNQSHASVSYGVELNNSFDCLVENNISQQITDSLPNNNGGAEGNVAGHNFAIADTFTAAGWMQASSYQHASGDAFWLWEGNIGPGYTADDVHGTHHFETLFRNYLIGNQASCGRSSCSAQTVPIHIYAASRYFNIIGNVLGQAGYHNNYNCLGSLSACSNGNTSIYTLGATGNGGAVNTSLAGFCLQPGCSTHGAYDPQTYNYLMRWGNYDTVTDAVRWCGNSSAPGWASTCNSTSEVPTNLSAYSNPVPTSTTLPPSFYLSTKPAWWGMLPYPAIGPDVVGGSGPRGLVYNNPAANCYASVLAGPADGSGAALPFDANTCYYSSSSTGPAPPTNLGAVVH